MDTTLSAPQHNTLKDWEDWLAPQVRRVELLGEIPITADECAQLGKVIGLRVGTLGYSRAMRPLSHLMAQAVAGTFRAIQDVGRWWP